MQITEQGVQLRFGSKRRVDQNMGVNIPAVRTYGFGQPEFAVWDKDFFAFWVPREPPAHPG